MRGSQMSNWSVSPAKAWERWSYFRQASRLRCSTDAVPMIRRGVHDAQLRQGILVQGVPRCKNLRLISTEMNEFAASGENVGLIPS